ncbi:MAG: signal peptidase I [Eubacterium sp.]
MRKSREDNKSNNDQSTIKYILSFLYTFITTVFVIVAICFIAFKVMGIVTLTVESGSMAPNYPKDSVVLVKETAPESIKVGDVITYVFNEKGMLVTHRVISTDAKERTFITKGDANNQQDPMPILWGNLVGKVVFCVPKIAPVIRFISNEKARPYIIAVVALIGVFSLAGDISKTISTKKSKKKDFDSINNQSN